MTKLEKIIAKGNRGHYGRTDSTIHCADGTDLSVIAGGGVYSEPRPAHCMCAFGGNPLNPFPGEVDHTYPGPYRAVEVMMVGDDPCPDGWQEYESGGIYAFVPVELVRAYVEAHGGEVNQ